MKQLLNSIRTCTVCRLHLPEGPKPIIQASAKSRIVIIGQAPGQRVHASGIPWNDASGNELRRWLNVTPAQFYDSDLFALVPMGFCYPGKGLAGDLPPRPECAPLWHNPLFSKMKTVKLTLLIGSYSQRYYLRESQPLTETVKAFRQYLPHYLPLVHPSPRNRIWIRKNPWFEQEVIPSLRKAVAAILE